MKIVNIVPFGNFKPGDEVEIPDGSEFDRGHFKEVVAVNGTSIEGSAE